MKLIKTSPLRVQPIPYQGSKRSLAPVILEHAPEKVQVLYEPFAGSAAVSASADRASKAETQRVRMDMGFLSGVG